MNMKRLGCVWVLLAFVAAPTWAVPITITVSHAPGDFSVAVGESIEIDVLADIPDPVIAFGVDLTFDDTLLSLTNTVFGSDWTPVPPPGPPVSDGVGFGALLTPTFPPPPSPGGLSGADILVLTLTFEALAPGSSPLQLSATPGDLTEGFALASGGFAEVNFVPGTVDIVPGGGDPVPVPEPATGALMLAGLFALYAHRRRYLM